MWAVFDEDRNEIIAFHKEKKIVKRYISLVQDCHPDNDFSLSLIKMKNKKAHKMDVFEELYLVRYHDTYVQHGYYVYLEIISGSDIYDEQFVLDILERNAVNPVYSKKEIKAIKIVMKLFDRLLTDDSKYTMTLSELKIAKTDYLQYFDKINAFEDIK